MFKLKLNFLLFFLPLLLFASSCDTTEPPIIPPPPPVVKDTITVTVESFTHRSITLSIQSTVNSLQSTIKVFRSFNNIKTVIAEYPIIVKDTTIIDDDNGTGLLLDTTYTYFAVKVDSLGQLKDTSNIITQKTLAPTSHNYTWQEFTIGDAGFSNTLYDFWGTDENNVWAVGTVMINDTAYGVLKWNGIEWKPALRRGGYNSIYGFANDDIWAVGNVIYHFDGTNWSENRNQVLNDNIPYTSIWGTSSNNFYLGNAWGKIIHWNGTKASVVSDSDNKPFNDMEGYYSEFIIAVGVDFSSPSAIKYFNGNAWNNYPYADVNKSLNGVSIITPFEIYWTGEGIYKTIRENFTEVFHSGYYIWDIEYNKYTGEVVAAGSFDGIYIYDGLTWNNFRGIISNDETTYSGIYLTTTKIFCVGSNDNQAKIIIGTKN